MEFYLPASQGEWLAWLSAVITALIGLSMFVAPKMTMRLMHMQMEYGSSVASAGIRGNMAGFYLGLALTSLIFAQPYLWLALGASWGFVALGRLISMLSEPTKSGFNWFALILEFLLAAGPLVFAFGIVA